MNLPSRGLRPSATTMRNTGALLAPTRFMRILTAIIKSMCSPDGSATCSGQPRRVSKKGMQSVIFLRNVSKRCFSVFGGPVSAPSTAPKRAKFSQNLTGVIQRILQVDFPHEIAQLPTIIKLELIVGKRLAWILLIQVPVAQV